MFDKLAECQILSQGSEAEPTSDIRQDQVNNIQSFLSDEGIPSIYVALRWPLPATIFDVESFLNEFWLRIGSW